MLNKIMKKRVVALVLASVLILSQNTFITVAEDNSVLLELHKRVDKTNAEIGEIFTYTFSGGVSVSGTEGNKWLDNLTITDQLPEHLEIVNEDDLPSGMEVDSNGLITYKVNNGSLQTGQPILDVSLSVRFKPDTPVGYVAENTAHISGVIRGENKTITADSETVTTAAETSEPTWKIEKTATSGNNPVNPSEVGGKVQVWYTVDIIGNDNKGMILYDVELNDTLPPNYYMESYKVGNGDEVVMTEPLSPGGTLGPIEFETLMPKERKRVLVKGYYQSGGANGVGLNTKQENTATATLKYMNKNGEKVAFGNGKSDSVEIEFAAPSYGASKIIKENRNGSSGNGLTQNYDRRKFGDKTLFRIYADDGSNMGLNSFVVRDILPEKVGNDYPFIPESVVIVKASSMMGIPDDMKLKAMVSLKKEDDTIVENFATVDVSDADGLLADNEVEVDISSEKDIKEILVKFFSLDNNDNPVLNPIGLSTALRVEGEIGLNVEDGTLYKNKARIMAYNSDDPNAAPIYDAGPSVASFKIEKGEPWLELEKEADPFVIPNGVSHTTFTYSNDSFADAPASLRNIAFYDYISAIDEEGTKIPISERDIKHDSSGNYEITADAEITRNGGAKEDVAVTYTITPHDNAYKVKVQFPDEDIKIEAGESVKVTLGLKIDLDAKYGYLTDKVFLQPSEQEGDYDIVKNENKATAADLAGTGLTSNYLVAEGKTFVQFDGIITGSKYVHGDLDVTPYWRTGNDTSKVVEGGTADYKLVISNKYCNGPISDFVLMDNLPRENDKMIKSGNPRGSQWQPVLINQIVDIKLIKADNSEHDVTASSHVFYSTFDEPSKWPLYNSDFELDNNGSDLAHKINGGDFDGNIDWNAKLPADLTKVKWMMIKYDDTLEKDEQLVTTWKMNAPVGTPIGEVTYNSFAYSATYIKSKIGGEILKGRLSPTEPSTVKHTVVPKSATSIQIGDMVWQDMNKNGLKDSNELGINGVLVLLYQGSDLKKVTRTANNADGTAGYYKFTEIPAGKYTVKFGIPKSDEDNFNAYIRTDANVGSDDLIDSDISSEPTDITFSRDGQFKIDGNIIGDGKEYRLFSSGEIDFSNQNMGLDFGLYRNAKIGNKVWEDINGDGIQNDGNTGIENVLVQLINADTNALVGTKKTDNKGEYSFEGVAPANYKLKFINLDYDTYFPTKAGIGNAENDSNIPFGTNNNYNSTDEYPDTSIIDDDTAGYRENTTDVFAILSGIDNKSVDAAYTKGYIGNLVFGDKDKDGVFNGNDAKISGVKVLAAEHDSVATPNLAKFVDVSPLSVSTSDNNGAYGIYGLKEGTYDLWFFVPENDTEHYELSTAKPFTDSDNGDNGQRLDNLSAVDQVFEDFNDANGKNINLNGKYRYGKISNVTINADNYRNTKYDVGLYVPGKISGSIFEDLNYNDQYDNNPDEHTADVQNAKARIYLEDASGNWIPYGSEIDITEGTYEFKDLPAGRYKVGIVLDDDSYGVVKKDTGNDNSDSDINDELSDGYYFTDPITVEYGTKLNNVNAGFRLARIGSKVYRDIDSNGIYGNNEELIGGATLELLDENDNPILDASNNPISVESQAGKEYHFEGLKAGTYKVVLKMPNTLDNILSLESLAVDTKDEVLDDHNYALSYDDTSNSHRRFVWSYKKNVNEATFELGKGEDFSKVDFAFVNHGIISGMIFEDLNNNGIRDDGELGISNLKVTLTRGTSTWTDTTDEHGLYAFGNLQENGTYNVEFEKVSEHILSPKDANNNNSDDVDSDAEEVNDKVVSSVDISSNDKESKHNDVGYFSGLQLKGKVFNDRSKNGIFDDDEEIFTTKDFTVSLYKIEGGKLVEAKDIFGRAISSIQTVDGFYHFKGLPDDDTIKYKLMVDVPRPYAIGPYKKGGDDEKDSDFEDTGYTDEFVMANLTNDYIKENLNLGVYMNSGDITVVQRESTSTSVGEEQTESTTISDSGQSTNVEDSSQYTGAPASTKGEVELSTKANTVKIEIVNPPEGGEAEIDENGNLKFTPNDDFSGATTVRVKVTYEDGTEEFMLYNITDDMFAQGVLALPKTGGIPITTYFMLGMMPLSAGLLLRKKKK